MKVYNDVWLLKKKACIFWEMDPESRTEKDTFKMTAQNIDTQKKIFSLITKVTVYSSISESFSSVA